MLKEEEESMSLAYLFHANYDSSQIAIASQEDEGRVCLAGLDRRRGGNVAVLWYAVLVWRVTFRAGQLFGDVR